MLREGTLPDGFTVKKRRLVVLGADSKATKKAKKQNKQRKSKKTRPLAA
jgi:hypothetical protein